MEQRQSANDPPAQWYAPSTSAYRPSCGTVRSAAPLTHALPDGLTWAPGRHAPEPLVVAPVTARESPLIHSFTQITVDTYRSART